MRALYASPRLRGNEAGVWKARVAKASASEKRKPYEQSARHGFQCRYNYVSVHHPLGFWNKRNAIEEGYIGATAPFRQQNSRTKMIKTAIFTKISSKYN
jgi:hypothetical protein